jgi:hypothetical protein
VRLPPINVVVSLTDREAETLAAPWWRRLAWTGAQWNAYARARAKIRRELVDG